MSICVESVENGGRKGEDLQKKRARAQKAAFVDVARTHSCRLMAPNRRIIENSGGRRGCRRREKNVDGNKIEQPKDRRVDAFLRSLRTSACVFNKSTLTIIGVFSIWRRATGQKTLARSNASEIAIPLAAIDRIHTTPKRLPSQTRAARRQTKLLA